MDDRELEAEIILASADTGYRLIVHCASQCGAFKDYLENVSYAPLSIYSPSDSNHLLYTTWGGGTGYRVKVYALTAGGVRSVLDEPTVGLPDFLTDKKGRFVVRTQMRPERDGPEAPTKGLDWTWTGSRFAPSS